MQLKDYIKSNRRGKEANRLERESMSDRFLQDALEGYDAVPGDHAKVIERLEKRYADTVVKDGCKIDSEPDVALNNKRKLFLFWSAAASILILIGFGTYFFVDRNALENAAIVMVKSDNNNRYSMDETLSLPQEVNMEAMQDELVESKITDRKKSAEKPMPVIIEIAENVITVEENDDVLVAADVTQSEALASENKETAENLSLTTAERTTKTMMQESEEMIDKKNPAKGQSKSINQDTRNRAISNSENNMNRIIFGKKEFQVYCRKMADKHVCDGKKVTVKVSFFINATGKPTDVKYNYYTCESAKNEMESLLSNSPVWTTTNQKVTMTIRW